MAGTARLTGQTVIVYCLLFASVLCASDSAQTFLDIYRHNNMTAYLWAATGSLHCDWWDYLCVQCTLCC